MSSLKDQKQQFVSDLLGGSLKEIYLIVGVSIASLFTFKILAQVLGNNNNGVLYIIHDLYFNVFLLVCSVTIYSNNILFMYKALGAASLLLFIVSLFVVKKTPKTQKPNVELLTPKSFVTAYRSHMLILTNIAILAVDFHVFPRRFAKVETWGTSIMDMGVGSFVFSMGVVNSRSLIKQNLLGSNTKKTQFSATSYFKLLISNTKKSMPMLVLGVIRLISVKGLEYQEHVTEYGIHWNFFITIGFLPIFIAILDPLFNLIPRFLVASLISVVYEIALCQGGLLKFILTSENRLDNILTMNKEGMFSFFGYLSIFIYGQSFGPFVLTNKPTYNNLISFTNTTKKSLLTVTTTTGLLITTVIYQLAFNIINESSYFHNVSRRLANLPYVLMIVAYNAFFLLCYNLIENFFGSNNTGSKILDSTNKNGLVFFLIGNLMTGLVNLTINTLECDNKLATIIIMGYATILVLITYLMNEYKIYIKI